MLRITKHEEPGDRDTLVLVGSVVGEWAALLDGECTALLRAGNTVSLDIAGVGFVDRIGIGVLRRLGRAGVEIRCRLGAVASVLEAEGVRVTHVPEGGA